MPSQWKRGACAKRPSEEGASDAESDGNAAVSQQGRTKAAQQRNEAAHMKIFVEGAEKLWGIPRLQLEGRPVAQASRSSLSCVPHLLSAACSSDGQKNRSLASHGQYTAIFRTKPSTIFTAVTGFCENKTHTHTKQKNTMRACLKCVRAVGREGENSVGKGRGEHHAWRKTRHAPRAGGADSARCFGPQTFGFFGDACCTRPPRARHKGQLRSRSKAPTTLRKHHVPTMFPYDRAHIANLPL